MTEQSKGGLQRAWDKLSDKLGDKLAEWFVATVVVAVVLSARRWIAEEWVCIQKPWCQVKGWSLGVLIATAVLTTLATGYLALKLFRTRRELRAARVDAAARAAAPAKADEAVKAEPPKPPPFRHITVEDERLKLRWVIREPPSAWLHWRNVAYSITPAYLREVLDGPFHSVAGCYAPMQEVFRHHEHPALAQKCPSCGEQIFRGRPGESGFGEETVSVRDVRAQALEELQRMERNGVKFDADAPVVLERPAYWKAMLPPRVKQQQK